MEQPVQRFQLVQSPRGGLLVWQAPEPGKDYVIGIDCASGAPGSDFASACVIEAVTCNLVAVWHEREDPRPWGKHMARLGWYYNEALLAFEVAPSAHGATAQESCQNVGYARLYRQRRLDVMGRPLGSVLGWTTDARSKDRMVNRVRQALEEDNDIPFDELINQLRIQKWDMRRDADMATRLNRKVRSDLFDSYAITLLARDYAWSAGIIRSEPLKPADESARFWARYEADMKRKYGTPRKPRLYAGY